MLARCIVNIRTPCILYYLILEQNLKYIYYCALTKRFIEKYYITYFIKAYRKRKIKDQRVKKRWLNYIKSQEKKEYREKKKQEKRINQYRNKN